MDGRIDYCELAFEKIIFIIIRILEEDRRRVCSSRDGYVYPHIYTPGLYIYIYVYMYTCIPSEALKLQKSSEFTLKLGSVVRIK